MEIVLSENGPFMVNTYVVYNESDNRGIIIDPGSGLGPLMDHLKDKGITLEAIVATHAHIDHITGVKEIQDSLGIPFYLNHHEHGFAESITGQARMFGVPNPGVPVVDKNLPEEGELSLAGLTFTLLHTPGHSPGSISLYTGNTVFSGDALFNLSIGRTDLPGGDYDQLITSIKEKLMSLPDDTTVLPGHGPATTIGAERQMNPFLR